MYIRRAQDYRRAVLLLAAGTGFALAHEGAKGVVKERMDLMKGQAKQMKLIGDMARGRRKSMPPRRRRRPTILALHTKKIPELFPEGSNGHPSEALDAVWKEWDSSKGDAEDAEDAANALAAAVRPQARIGRPSFQKMTDACKSCHETFRAKEEEGKEGHHD